MIGMTRKERDVLELCAVDGDIELTPAQWREIEPTLKRLIEQGRVERTNAWDGFVLHVRTNPTELGRLALRCWSHAWERGEA